MNAIILLSLTSLAGIVLSKNVCKPPVPNDKRLDLALQPKRIMGAWHLRKVSPSHPKTNYSLTFIWKQDEEDFDFLAENRFHFVEDDPPVCTLETFECTMYEDDNRLNIVPIPLHGFVAQIWTFDTDYDNFMIRFFCKPNGNWGCEFTQYYVFTRQPDTDLAPFWKRITKLAEKFCVTENSFLDVFNEGGCIGQV